MEDSKILEKDVSFNHEVILQPYTSCLESVYGIHKCTMYVQCMPATWIVLTGINFN